jgi:cytochrome b subunit of formate dehydrogenase
MAPSRWGRPCILVLPALLILLVLTLPAAAQALDNGECLDCHGSSDIVSWSDEDKAGTVEPGGPPEVPRGFEPFPGVSLFVDPAGYKASVHADLFCTDCHADVRELPHTARLEPVDCSGCHDQAAAVHAENRHALGHDGSPLAQAIRCADCHGAHAIAGVGDPRSPVSHRNVSDTCLRCHRRPEVVARTGIPGAGMQYENSIHNRAITRKGLTGAAACPDCHGAHDVKDRLDPSASIFRANVPALCGKCHFGAYTIFRDSVHGVAFARNVPDAPGCTDCHGEHDIRRAEEPGSSVSFAAVSERTCSSCHAAERLAALYGVPIDKVRGYEQSFHGLSQRLGDKTVANCASCHGNHAIFPSSDPRSTVHPENLPITCGGCHPGATENFAKGTIHVGVGGPGGRIKSLVETFYIWLIVLVIGGMVLHNGADYVRKMQDLYRKRREWEHPGYERLNRSERIQHVLTFSTFIILAITGFALKFKWSLPLLADETNVFLRTWGHRAAAIVMVATSLYHVYYAVSTARGRDQFQRMMPTLQDARDIVGMLKYFAGLTDHKPKFGRYSYIEKAEYLALVWGTVIMIVTGFLLWFHNEALRHIPMWGMDVATLIHYYEAILATLAIIVWHFYYVFINPDFAPMSFTWIDGKLSRHHMEHEHPLELEEIEGRARPEEAGETGPPRIATEET